MHVGLQMGMVGFLKFKAKVRIVARQPRVELGAGPVEQRSCKVDECSVGLVIFVFKLPLYTMVAA